MAQVHHVKVQIEEKKKESDELRRVLREEHVRGTEAASLLNEELERQTKRKEAAQARFRELEAVMAMRETTKEQQQQSEASLGFSRGRKRR